MATIELTVPAWCLIPSCVGVVVAITRMTLVPDAFRTWESRILGILWGLFILIFWALFLAGKVRLFFVSMGRGYSSKKDGRVNGWVDQQSPDGWEIGGFSEDGEGLWPVEDDVLLGSDRSRQEAQDLAEVLSRVPRGGGKIRE